MGDSITLEDLCIGTVYGLMRVTPTANRIHPRRRSLVDQAVAIANCEVTRCSVERIESQMVVSNRMLEINFEAVVGPEVAAFHRQRRLAQNLD